MRARRTARQLATPLALVALLAGCGGDDGGDAAADATATATSEAGANDAASADESDAASADAPAGGDVAISGVIHGDVDGATSTNCVYVDDAELGRVYLNPVGDFEGFFRTVTDGSDPEYLTELVTADGTVVIEKGATAAITGTTDFTQMRCTQGDETEIAITGISAG